MGRFINREENANSPGSEAWRLPIVARLSDMIRMRFKQGELQAAPRSDLSESAKGETTHANR